VEKLRGEGILVFKQFSILGCYYISRAKVHIICKSKLEDLNKYLSYKSLLVNLFHGLHSRRACILSAPRQNKAQWRIDRNKEKMIFFYNRCLLLFVTSKFTQQAFSKLFEVDDFRLPILGMPRLNRLYSKQTDRGYIISNISPFLEKFDTIFAYMPSKRSDGFGRNHDWSHDIDFDKMNNFLLRNNSALIVRSHRHEGYIYPNNTHSNIYGSSAYSQDWSDAIDELIGVDVLISDDSSLVYEFLITNRPILNYFPDHCQFKKMFDMVAIDKNLPSDRIDSFDDLLVSMNAVVQKQYSYDKYNKIRDKYHLYQDSNSSKRVYKYINKILSN
jgi:CDP-glycerol glycerophosphotransferase (TagB/SpsB family)